MIVFLYICKLEVRALPDMLEKCVEIKKQPMKQRNNPTVSDL